MLYEKWGLSNSEYDRYIFLKESIRRVHSTNLDPVTTLGIKARNDVERRHYAELWVK